LSELKSDTVARDNTPTDEWSKRRAEISHLRAGYEALADILADTIMRNRHLEDQRQRLEAQLAAVYRSSEWSVGQKLMRVVDGLVNAVRAPLRLAGLMPPNRRPSDRGNAS
jgi:hypothetical protein